jgi:hypothetical protein
MISQRFTEGHIKNNTVYSILILQGLGKILFVEKKDMHPSLFPVFTERISVLKKEVRTFAGENLPVIFGKKAFGNLESRTTSAFLVQIYLS